MKFPTFYGNRRFITAFTSVRHLSLSWASSIQSISPHPTSWRSILILSSHLCLGLPSGIFPFRFPHQNPVYVSPLPNTCYMPCQAHSFRFNHLDSIGWAVPNVQLLILLSLTPRHDASSLRREERPQIWRVAAKILNKQSRIADTGWSSILGGWT